jgi:hypothetical protein
MRGPVRPRSLVYLYGLRSPCHLEGPWILGYLCSLECPCGLARPFQGCQRITRGMINEERNLDIDEAILFLKDYIGRCVLYINQLTDLDQCQRDAVRKICL